jgi:hypothetical protein
MRALPLLLRALPLLLRALPRGEGALPPAFAASPSHEWGSALKVGAFPLVMMVLSPLMRAVRSVPGAWPLTRKA